MDKKSQPEIKNQKKQEKQVKKKALSEALRQNLLRRKGGESKTFK